MAYLGQDVYAHLDQDVRRALAPLAAMAERTGAAVLVVRHLNKKSGEAAIYRGGGSIGIIGAARSALLLAKDPTDDTGLSRVLASTKCNVARPPSSLRFTFAEQSNKMTTVEWQGVSPHTSDVLMAPPPTEEQRNARRSAETFLAEALKDGPRDSKAVANDAKAFGISERTLRRAREKICLAVKDPNVNADGSWSWKWMLKDRTVDEPVAKPRKF
jgi:hypothetical protein